MAHIFVHAVGATAGGGATYIRHFLDQIRYRSQEHQWTVLLPDAATRSTAPITLSDIPPHVKIITDQQLRSRLGRVYLDQVTIRNLVKREKMDLILATGNFGVINPPVPQILLNRNPLYFNSDHVINLRRRREYKELINIMIRRRLAIASIRSSALNITPTTAFTHMIQESAPQTRECQFQTIYHGFDKPKFTSKSELSPALKAKLRDEPGVRRILMVSHYNYFRNFETLIRGFAELVNQASFPCELVLTTKLGDGLRDQRYDTTVAYRLAESLGVLDRITMLGNVPYADLHGLYRYCDVCVCPAYAESFGHPMVEAMAACKPIVASDCGVQREMCGEAALYFPRVDAEILGHRLLTVLEDPALAQQLGQAGDARSSFFSWNKHFDELLRAINQVLDQSDDGASSNSNSRRTVSQA